MWGPHSGEGLFGGVRGEGVPLLKAVKMQELFLSATAFGVPVLHCPLGGELPLQQAVELHQHLWSLQLLLLTLWLLPGSPAHAAWQCQTVVFLAMSRTLL